MGEEVEILRPHPIPRYTALPKPENAQGKPRISASTHLVSSVSDNKQEQFTALGRQKIVNDTGKQDLLKAEGGAGKQTLWHPGPSLSTG